MSVTLRYWQEKAIVLGGVATGNMKANDADTVAGIMKQSGLTSRDFA